jgi:hypothetical protein
VTRLTRAAGEAGLAPLSRRHGTARLVLSTPRATDFPHFGNRAFTIQGSSGDPGWALLWLPFGKFWGRPCGGSRWGTVDEEMLRHVPVLPEGTDDWRRVVPPSRQDRHPE